jgi:hypothetical protein
MGIRKVRDVGGTPIEDYKQGDNPYRTVKKLYEYGRVYPDGRPHDYKTPEKTPASKPIAKDESQPQFAEERTANHDDVREGWTRGYGSPHPAFDRGPSGSRYSKGK